MIKRLIQHLSTEFQIFESLNDWHLLLHNLNVPDGSLSILEKVSHRRTFQGTCDVCVDWKNSKPIVKTMLTSEVIAKYLEYHKNSSSQTREMYNSVLKRFNAVSEYLPTEPEPVEQFLSKFTHDTTRYDYFKVLRNFFRWAEKRFEVPNPTNKMQLPRLKRKVVPSLSAEELRRLFNQSLSDRDKAVLMVLAGCGIRVGEAKNLIFSDIGEDRLKIRGKIGERTVPLTKEIKESLFNLRNGQKPNDSIFRGNHDHKPLQEGGIQILVKQAFKNAGIEGKRASPHTLRHTFARNWIVNGGDVSSLQVILGHTNLQRTQQYIALEAGDIISKNQKFNPLNCISNISSIKSDISLIKESLSPDEERLIPLEKCLSQW